MEQGGHERFDIDESLPDQETRINPVPRPGYHGKYPRWIGHKFDIDGTVLPFPGHGIMCPVPAGTAMSSALQQLHDELQQQDFASSLVFLPPSSWHMTVYEGVSDKIRRRNLWPAELRLEDCSLQHCTDFVGAKLKRFNLGCEPQFRMTATGWDPVDDGVVLQLAGVDFFEEKKLRRLRDRLAKLLQLRHPGFDTYVFHIGIAYQLRLLERQQKQDMADCLRTALKKLPNVFELGAPEFCTYEDMFGFERQFYLANESSDRYGEQGTPVAHATAMQTA